MSKLQSPTKTHWLWTVRLRPEQSWLQGTIHKGTDLSLLATHIWFFRRNTQDLISVFYTPGSCSSANERFARSTGSTSLAILNVWSFLVKSLTQRVDKLGVPQSLEHLRSLSRTLECLPLKLMIGGSCTCELSIWLHLVQGIRTIVQSSNWEDSGSFYKTPPSLRSANVPQWNDILACTPLAKGISRPSSLGSQSRRTIPFKQPALTATTMSLTSGTYIIKSSGGAHWSQPWGQEPASQEGSSPPQS